MKKNYKYIITSVIFLGIVAYAGLYICINNFEEIKDIILKDSDIKEKIQAIEDVYREIPNEDGVLLDIYSLEQRLIKTSFYEDPEYGMLIKDTHGKLQVPCGKYEVGGFAENIKKFNEELNKINIPLVYVQYPGKTLEGYTEFPISEYSNQSNESADDLINLIEDGGVKYLDLRDKIIEQDLDRDSLFYKTDHHWTTDAAFWGTGEIVRYINNTLNFNIDESIVDRENYNFKKYENCFLGLCGLRLGKYVMGLDDYTFIYPKFDTEYEIYYSKESKTKPTWVGDFVNAIGRKDILESKDLDLQAYKYNSYFGKDYGTLVIKNKKMTDGKKILILKNSYSLPVAAFLSTGVQELHLIDLRDPDAPNDLIDYVKDNNLEAVMIMYDTQYIDASMFEFVISK